MCSRVRVHPPLNRVYGNYYRSEALYLLMVLDNLFSYYIFCNYDKRILCVRVYLCINCFCVYACCTVIVCTYVCWCTPAWKNGI